MHLVRLLPAVLSLGSLAGCSGDSEPANTGFAKPESRGTIGATCMTLANPFFSTIHIITAGIDLSVGSLIALSSVAAAS